MPDYGTVMMPTHIPKLDAVEPDGRVRPPVIALVGPEHVGKSTKIVEFSADPRIGQTWVVEWGAGDKGVLNEYSRLEGARFRLLNHNNTVESVFGQVLAAREVARAAVRNGEPPHMLAIDSWSTCWELIKSWTYRRAAIGMTAASDGPVNPNRSVNPGRDQWNDARGRYGQFMTVLLSWPGPVVLTCRAEWVSGTNENGQPTRDREYSIEAHKSLKGDVTVIVRMNRAEPHVLWKCRSIYYRVDPGVDPIELPELDLGDLVFNKMRFDPASMVIPDTEQRLDPIPEAPQPPVIGRGQGPRGGQRAGEPRSMPIDWDAKLAELTAKHEQDWETLHPALLELWTAAKFGNASEQTRKRIEQAGHDVKHQLWKARFASVGHHDTDKVAELAELIAEARVQKVDVDAVLAELDGDDPQRTVREAAEEAQQ